MTEQQIEAIRQIDEIARRVELVVAVEIGSPRPPREV
jgi:hypothetical protein